MASVSYARAGMACLPVVGPFVSIWNAELSARELAEKQRSQANMVEAVCEKIRIYSICGLVGNIATVALTVRLVALGILTGILPAGAITVFSIWALLQSYHVGRYTQYLDQQSVPSTPLRRPS
jgi:hypothetical protein